jgi:hypothetical protein
MGHNKNKGANIQSRISPKSERRRKTGTAVRAVAMGCVFLTKLVTKILPMNA